MRGDTLPQLHTAIHQEFIDKKLSSKQLDELCKRYHLNKMDVHTLLHPEHYELIMADAPDVADNEINSTIGWQLTDRLGFPHDQAVIDSFKIPPGPRNSGQKPRLYVAAVHRDIVSQLSQPMLKAHINLKVINIGEMALRNIALQLPESSMGVVMLHLFADSGMLTIIHNADLYLTRRFMMGSNQIYKLWKEANASEFVLEDEHGLPQSDELTTLLDKIVVDIQRSLDFYTNNTGMPPVAAIVLTPMPTNIKGLPEYLQQQMGIQVRQLDLNSMVESESEMSSTLQAQMVLPLGAALLADMHPSDAGKDS